MSATNQCTTPAHSKKKSEKSEEKMSIIAPRPVRLDDGQILERFNQALKSIVPSDRKALQIEAIRTNELPPNMPPQLPSAMWYPDGPLAHPFPPFHYNYVMEPPRAATEERRPICHVPDVNGHGILQPHQLPEYDEFDEWIDGSTKLRYSPYSREAQAHISGWAMKYTNNHNKYVLKKTCVGVLLCSEDCVLPNGLKIVVRPAISDKVRERQIGQSCPNASCTGNLVHRKCTGNNGYPVTHFWIHQEDGIYFETKGTHDHFRPQARRATQERSCPGKNGASKQGSEQTEGKPVKEEQETNVGLTTPRRSRKRKNPDSSDACSVKNETVVNGNFTNGSMADEEEQYVCITIPETETLVQSVLTHPPGGIPSFGRLYLLCQTVSGIIPGFNLLETRMISHGTSGWPVVMATLYKQGTREGILEHMKTLTRICSSSGDDFYSPKWQMVIHDFTIEQSQLVTESIVNMIINSQVQTLLKVFQYKSVSSLYKMLREKITSSLQSYETHFELCKREIVSRLQDPFLTLKFDDIMALISSEKCSVQDYISADCLLSGGMFGSVIREFWNFWGNCIVAAKVFPVALAVIGGEDATRKFQRKYLDIELPKEPEETSLQLMSEIVLRWFQTQADCRPKSVVQESMDKFSHLRPEERNTPMFYCPERRGSAFHRPVAFPPLHMPAKLHWL